MISRIFNFLLPGLALGLCSSLAWGNLTHEYKLENGLKLIVREDHRAPVLISQVWYKVGSYNEYNGLTGISHALEHMMFKGTSKYGEGEFSRMIEAQGGQENAFTSREYTAYYQKLKSDDLELSFQLEADRMANLQLKDEAFSKEIKVIEEERLLRTDDNPVAFSRERFYLAAYPASSYRNPVIGWMDDIKALNVDKLKKWYKATVSFDNPGLSPSLAAPALKEIWISTIGSCSVATKNTGVPVLVSQ